MIERELSAARYRPERPGDDGIEVDDTGPRATFPIEGDFLVGDDLQHFAIYDAVPTGSGFVAELEMIADLGFEIAFHEPLVHQCGIGDAFPYGFYGMGEKPFEVNISFHDS